MKISAWWLLAALLIGIAAAFVYFKFFYTPADSFSVNERRNDDLIILALPNNADPVVFGPKYWHAFHKLSERIPCPGCRGKAVPFMNFFHDVVNKETGKPLFDKDNFNKHIDMISKMPKA